MKKAKCKKTISNMGELRYFIMPFMDETKFIVDGERKPFTCTYAIDDKGYSIIHIDTKG